MYMPMLERYWTVEEVQQLPDDGNRYEVIDGELFVTPTPNPAHREAVMVLYGQIAEYLGRVRVGHAVTAPADVVFSPRRAVQPDLFVLPLIGGRTPRRFTDVGQLRLAVEVLSPSTARQDRVDKRVMYREERVDEYWIVDLDSRTIERSTPTDLRVEVATHWLEWAPRGASMPLVIDVADYFKSVLED